MIYPFHHRNALPEILRGHGVRHVVNAGTEEMGAAFARAGLKVICGAGVAAEVAARACGGGEAPQAVWLDGDLSYRGTVAALAAWADALPDGALLAGAGYVRTLHRPQGAPPSMVNVPDAIAEVRRTRPFLSEPLLTWNEGWPSWLLFKRERIPTVEILSAATPDTPWWPEVEAHHRRYAERHGYEYAGRTMPSPQDRGPVWLKIALLRERMQESRADWFFWLDADAMFWDIARPLAGYTPPQVWDGVFAQFWRGRDCLSSGAFFLRNSGAARELMDVLWSRGKGGGYNSEEMELATLAPHAKAKLLLTDHRDFNSLPTGGIWHGGGRDFVMHAAFLKEGRTELLRDLIARGECGTEWPAAAYLPSPAVPSQAAAPAPAVAPPPSPPTPPLYHGFAA